MWDNWKKTLLMKNYYSGKIKASILSGEYTRKIEKLFTINID